MLALEKLFSKSQRLVNDNVDASNDNFHLIFKILAVKLVHVIICSLLGSSN